MIDTDRLGNPLKPGAEFEATADDFPTGIAGELQVRIVNTPDDVELLAPTADGIIESPAGSGLYGVVLAAPADAAGGAYSVVWDDQNGTWAREELRVHPAGTVAVLSGEGYPDVATLVANSNVSALTGADPGEQERLRRASIVAVEEFCQQKFESTGVPETEVLDGPGGRRLYLPKRLSELTALEVEGSSITEVDVLLNEGGDWLDVKPASGWGGNYYERVSRAADGIVGLDFTFGYSAVAVTGIWGWQDDEFPAQVADAILKDMEDTALIDNNKLTPTIRQYRHLGVRDIAQGNMRASIGGSPVLSPDAQQLLTGLVWTPPLGALA